MPIILSLALSMRLSAPAKKIILQVHVEDLRLSPWELRSGASNCALHQAVTFIATNGAPPTCKPINWATTEVAHTGLLAAMPNSNPRDSFVDNVFKNLKRAFVFLDDSSVRILRIAHEYVQ